MSVYKPFKPQDYAVVPFNAHKQYDFTSASAATNKVTYSTTYFDYDSPIDEYNDANIKYSQLEHLYYRNYITDIANKFGDINYLKHKRTLYETANVLSIPAGLYGHKINPGSFFLSSSKLSIVDDNYGNLILEGTDINGYITDPRSTLLDIGPIKGFKNYDLSIHDIFIEGLYDKRGQKRTNLVDSYNTPSDKHEYDDSYFLNKIFYKDVKFDRFYFDSGNTSKSLSCIEFNGTNSEVKINHDPKFNFNKENDFSIEFWINLKNQTSLNEKVYIISKSTTKNTPYNSSDSSQSTTQLKTSPSEQSYPFEIYFQNGLIFFERSDGTNIVNTSKVIDTTQYNHIICNYSSSLMNIYVNGVKQYNTDVTNNAVLCQNNANIYIGSKGGNTNYFSGSLSQIKIYNQALTQTQATNHYNSINGSPYIGNIFHSNGLITITHPKYQQVLNYFQFGIGTMTVDNENEAIGLFTVGGVGGIGNLGEYFGISNLKFEGSHLIYENEYQCKIEEHEFNHTLNPSARQKRSINNDEIADFAQNDLFKPYVTTIGLYNENNELLVVGKLGQPIKKSDKTDTTFIVRWDT